jgi:hypothetical protein
MLLLMTLTVLSSAMVAFAEEENTPELTAITFKNAEIVGKFDPSKKTDYQIELKDPTKTPTLESYEVSGEAKLFVNYSFDAVNSPVGIIVTLEYYSGSKIYSFNYANAPEKSKSDNCKITAIYADMGEIRPEVSPGVTDYKLYLPIDLEVISISLIPEDPSAYCRPIKAKIGAETEGKIPFECVAPNGDKREYTIHIKRVNKTVMQVREEMAQEGYTTFVEGTKIYEKPEFILIAGAVAIGLITLLFAVSFAKKRLVKPYDPDEPKFYLPADGKAAPAAKSAPVPEETAQEAPAEKPEEAPAQQEE